MEQDNYYMNLAIKQAHIAEKAGEVPVGSIIVDDSGTIIGQGYNKPISNCDPTSHAEIQAIRMAALSVGNYRLCNTIIYVTIEPCIMCMGAIIHARIKKLVYGASDPKWGGAGSLYSFNHDKRLNHNLEVVSGVCFDETQKIIRDFFKNKRSNKQCPI